MSVEVRSKKAKTRVRAKNEENVQEHLEAAILAYQKALRSRDAGAIDEAYAVVCSIYPPMKHINEWYNKYYFLFDSPEDFTQEYIYLFCKSLSRWKPRNQRGTSRYDGSGEFKNYFISTLQNNYSNMVKETNAGKRNNSCKCPICETWASPLQSHLRKHHIDLLWDQLAHFGYDIETLSKCPFCKSHKVPRKAPCPHVEDGTCEQCLAKATTEAIKKHMLSKHSTFLFQRFAELYPEYQTMYTKPSSVYYGEDEDGEELSHYETMSSDDLVNRLLACDLTETEQRILEKILLGKAKSVKYNPSLYNCTAEEFDNAMESIKDKMMLVGFEG